MRDPLTFCPSNGPPLEVGPAISTVACRKRSRGATGDTFSSSLMLRPLLDPALQPKLVRCGVNESVDATAAVTTIIGGLLRDARGHMPRAQFVKCCQLFLRFVDQVAGRGEDAEQGLPEYSEHMPDRMGDCEGEREDAKGLSAQVGIMLQALCNVTAQVMQEDAPEVRAACCAVCSCARWPTAAWWCVQVAWAACEARRQQLLRRVEQVGMSWGMSWYCLMTDAKRMVRYLVTETVGPQRISFDRVRPLPIPCGPCGSPTPPLTSPLACRRSWCTSACTRK